MSDELNTLDRWRLFNTPLDTLGLYDQLIDSVDPEKLLYGNVRQILKPYLLTVFKNRAAAHMEQRIDEIEADIYETAEKLFCTYDLDRLGSFDLQVINTQSIFSHDPMFNNIFERLIGRSISSIMF